MEEKKTEQKAVLGMHLFPVVRFDPSFRAIERNRLAEKLLPSRRILCAFLKNLIRGEGEERFFLRELDGVWYFIFLFPESDGYRAVFTESLTSFSAPLIQNVLEEASRFLDQCVLPVEDVGDFGEQGTEAALSRIAARTVRFRQEIRSAHRFLSLSEKRFPKILYSDVAKWLALLEQTLSRHRIRFSFQGEDFVAAVPPEELVMLILNLVQFASVYEGDPCPTVETVRLGEQNEIRFTFSQNEGVFPVFSCLWKERGNFENASVTGFFPLLSAMAICQCHQIVFDLEVREMKGVFSVKFPLASFSAETFLGATEKGSAKMVEDWIEKFFSPYKGDL